MAEIPNLKWEPINAVEAINWNNIDDQKDLEVWNRLTGNFWLPEKVPLSNDIPSWQKLSDDEKTLVMHVFAGLTLLDTIQGDAGAVRLMHDAITSHEKAVFGNITFMEAFAGDTKLMTPHGWKFIKDITADDLVAQFDPVDHSISFVHPTIVKPHYGATYEITSDNGNARQVVSSGHRVYLEHNRLHDGERTWTPETYEAHELTDSVNLNTAFRRFVTSGKAKHEGRGLSASDRLKIAIQADGSFKAGSSPRYTGSKNGVIPVRFGFSKGRKIERLRELASAAGWELRQLADNRDESCFNLMVPVSEIGDRDKHFDAWWNLDEISLQWAQEFIEESGLWDGHALKDGYGVTYYTNDKRNADFYMAVATLADYRGHMSIDSHKSSEGYKDGYVINVSYSKNSVSAQSMHITQSEPQEVYCVQVPTTYLVTWNGASPVISGNCVHAKSYSYIFQTLASTTEINDAFDWSNENEYLQKKAQNVLGYYNGQDPLEVKVMSVLLESFLFYSGFFLPFWMSSHAKLTNVADVIRLILRDESIHGYYIGYKFQKGLQRLDDAGRERIRDFTFGQVDALYDNEVKYTKTLYDPVGLTDKVLPFLKYNANKALQNLGFDNLYAADDCQVDPAIMSALSPNADENHDFFSGSGSSYTMGNVTETDDEDWDF